MMMHGWVKEDNAQDKNVALLWRMHHKNNIIMAIFFPLTEKSSVKECLCQQSIDSKAIIEWVRYKRQI